MLENMIDKVVAKRLGESRVLPPLHVMFTMFNLSKSIFGDVWEKYFKFVNVVYRMSVQLPWPKFCVRSIEGGEFCSLDRAIRTAIMERP